MVDEKVGHVVRATNVLHDVFAELKTTLKKVFDSNCLKTHPYHNINRCALHAPSFLIQTQHQLQLQVTNKKHLVKEKQDSCANAKSKWCSLLSSNLYHIDPNINCFNIILPALQQRVSWQSSRKRQNGFVIMATLFPKISRRLLLKTWVSIICFYSDIHPSDLFWTQHRPRLMTKKNLHYCKTSRTVTKNIALRRPLSTVWNLCRRPSTRAYSRSNIDWFPYQKVI